MVISTMMFTDVMEQNRVDSVGTLYRIPYGGKLWRVQTLAEWQGKHHWRNKLWRIDDKSLIKRILKQFEYKFTHNWSIRVHVFARLCIVYGPDRTGPQYKLRT